MVATILTGSNARKDEMKEYEVSVATKEPVVYATYTVKANSKKEAIRKAKKMFTPDEFNCVSAKLDWTEVEAQKI